jgi:hypothetical protein
MAQTARAPARKKRQAAKRPTKAKVRVVGAREGRLARRAAQKDAAAAVVAHINSENSREYRKKNPTPAEFWDQPTAE